MGLRRDRIVLEALLPAGAHPALPLGARDAGMDAFLKEFRSQAPASLRLGLEAALWAAAWLSPLLIGRCPPLSLHPPEARERALAAMARSKIYLLRQLLLLLKLACGLCYGAHPAVRAAVGRLPQGGGAPGEVAR